MSKGTIAILVVFLLLILATLACDMFIGEGQKAIIAPTPKKSDCKKANHTRVNGVCRKNTPTPNTPDLLWD